MLVLASNAAVTSAPLSDADPHGNGNEHVANVGGGQVLLRMSARRRRRVIREGAMGVPLCWGKTFSTFPNPAYNNSAPYRPSVAHTCSVIAKQVEVCL